MLFKFANKLRKPLVCLVRFFRYINNYVTVAKLKAMGVNVEWSAIVHPSAVFELSGGSIEIGERTHIDRGVIIRAMGGGVKIGSDCSVNAYSFISGAGGVKIRNYVMIGSHVSIYASNHVFVDITLPMNTQGLDLKGVEIEEDVWVGTGVRILDGVRIGSGAVLAAGAVISKSIDSFSIVGGVPAKEISSRLK
jgi:acetyltransferase-like isoleucine patch superfamily enzyme